MFSHAHMSEGTEGSGQRGDDTVASVSTLGQRVKNRLYDHELHEADSQPSKFAT
jgi:hypothetical protein